MSDSPKSDSLKFGTSGLRGLASDLVGAATRRYVTAFLRHLKGTGRLGTGAVFLGRDLRASSPAILADAAAAIAAFGLEPVDCGVLPTPALALEAMAKGGPAIMITGSHIPPDRNGLKFYAPDGEIAKADEAGILGALADDVPVAPIVARDGYAAAGDRYRRRYRGIMAPDLLSAWRIGVFEHSSTARDILVSLLTRAGADVVRIGRTEDFVAVDTEAFNDPIYADRQAWIQRHKLDAIVSTDGDGDRPLVIDKSGEFIRGDVLGLLAARFVGAHRVVTPVTSNSAIEAVGWFEQVIRTRVGSPFVIEGMARGALGGHVVVGFEANGGTLLGSDVDGEGVRLTALPTRDAVLPIIAALSLAAGQGMTLGELVAQLPIRAALSDRLAEVPPQRSAEFLRRLKDETLFAEGFFSPVGAITALSDLDGLRFTFESGDIVHYRASGNAPELRCYVEGMSPVRARELLVWGMAAAESVVR